MKQSLRRNVPPSYRRQVVFHARRTKSGHIEDKPTQLRFHTPTERISYTGFARVISLLVTAKHACGDGFLPIMCKFCPKFLPIMCNFYSKFLPIMCKRLANPSKMSKIEQTG